MATGVKKPIEPIHAPTGVRRGGSWPKPPKAGARSASLEAPRPTPDRPAVLVDSTNGRIAKACLCWGPGAKPWAKPLAGPRVYPSGLPDSPPCRAVRRA
jgi:hypothetical protein